MPRRTRTLSVDDQKAIDVCLDHAVSAQKGLLTRVAVPAEQKRLDAANQLLSLLAELPAADPPADLVSRTLQRIDQQEARNIIRPVPQVDRQAIH
jgi:hypothetical protein